MNVCVDVTVTETFKKMRLTHSSVSEGGEITVSSSGAPNSKQDLGEKKE